MLLLETIRLTICYPSQVECRVCQTSIYPGREVLCSVRGCQAAYHLKCANEKLGFSSSRKFKCPQHVRSAAFVFYYLIIGDNKFS